MKDLKLIDTNLLTSHLDQLLNSLTAFYTILEEENKSIRSNKPEALIKVVESKATAAEQIQTDFSKIQSDLDLPELSLIELLDSDLYAKAPKSVQTTIQQLVSLSQKCNDLNIANGMAIQSLNNINDVAIQILSGTEPSVKLYGASGKTTSTGNKKPLGKA